MGGAAPALCFLDEDTHNAILAGFTAQADAEESAEEAQEVAAAAAETAEGSSLALEAAGEARAAARAAKSFVRYTDELGDHWQKQFTEKAADPTAVAYTGHSSGFRDDVDVGLEREARPSGGKVRFPGACPLASN